MNRNEAIRLWAKQHNVAFAEAIKLMKLVDEAEKAQSDWHNGDASEKRANDACQAVCDHAAKLGYTTDWPGIFPILLKDGNAVHLPDYNAVN